MYQLIDLSGPTAIGEPGPLPQELQGASGSGLLDLSWMPAEYGYQGKGFWPLELDDPSFDPASETLDEPTTYTLDQTREAVKVRRTKRPLTPDELAPFRDARRGAVMEKRDAVINGGFTFDGTRFQTRPDDRENVAGAAQLAFMAMMGGVQPGDLHWHGEIEPFAWIAEDNSLVQMDAPTVINFAKAAASFKSACVFYARELKDQIDAAANPGLVNIETGWPA